MSPLAAHAPNESRPAGPKAGGSKLSRTAVHYAEAAALPLGMVVIALFFSLYPVTSATYPTAANFQATAGNQSVLAILTIAAMIPLCAGEFDLSVGATLSLGAVFAGSAMQSGTPLALAILLAVGIGAVVGVANGLLITRLRVNSVIATLGTAIIIEGIIQAKSHGQSIVEGIPSGLATFGGGNTAGIPNTVFVMAAIALLAYYLLVHTPFGVRLYAMGSNPEGAKLIGVNTRRTLVSSFVLAGVLAGAAAILQISRSGSADPAVGAKLTLPALAAAFLSAASIKPGRFNVGGAIVAIFFLAALNSGLNLSGAETYVNDLVNGTALICGVALAGFLGRARAR
ncbi:MAG: ABC transporter permease [Actinobacteria bacterium]|nr:ABC transporter permease [Actinomycetota bacterium]